MIRKICADEKKRKKTNGSMYFHNSYFFLDDTTYGISDKEIALHISRSMSHDAGVQVDVVCFMEVDDQENRFLTPNDLLKFTETKPITYPVGAHRFIICDKELFREYMQTGETA